MEKREANLLPSCCTNDDSSSSSSSSDESSDAEEPRTYASGKSYDDNFKTAVRVKRNKRNRKKKQSKWFTYWNRFKSFAHSPRVHFVYDASFYIIFLMLFSYMILCEFNYYETIDEEIIEYENNSASANLTNFTSNSHDVSNSTNSPLNQTKLNFRTIIVQNKVIKNPSWIEYLLIYWIIAFIAEETRQVNTKKMKKFSNILIKDLKVILFQVFFR